MLWLPILGSAWQQRVASWVRSRSFSVILILLKLYSVACSNQLQREYPLAVKFSRKISRTVSAERKLANYLNLRKWQRTEMNLPRCWEMRTRMNHLADLRVSRLFVDDQGTSKLLWESCPNDEELCNTYRLPLSEERKVARKWKTKVKARLLEPAKEGDSTSQHVRRMFTWISYLMNFS